MLLANPVCIDRRTDRSSVQTVCTSEQKKIGPIFRGRVPNKGGRQLRKKLEETETVGTDYKHNEEIMVYRVESKRSSSWNLRSGAEQDAWYM